MVAKAIDDRRSHWPRYQLQCFAANKGERYALKISDVNGYPKPFNIDDPGDDPRR